jgi:tetratricopeptide (TPR) repeat protein
MEVDPNLISDPLDHNISGAFSPSSQLLDEDTSANTTTGGYTPPIAWQTDTGDPSPQDDQIDKEALCILKLWDYLTQEGSQEKKSIPVSYVQDYFAYVNKLSQQNAHDKAQQVIQYLHDRGFIDVSIVGEDKQEVLLVNQQGQQELESNKKVLETLISPDLVLNFLQAKSENLSVGEIATWTEYAQKFLYNRKIANEKVVTYIKTVMSLVKFLNFMNNPAMAEVWYGRAARILKKAGDALYAHKKYEGAQDAYQQLLAIKEEKQLHDNKEIDDLELDPLLYKIGCCLHYQGAWSFAHNYYVRSLKIRQSIYGNQPHYDLADAYLKAGQTLLASSVFLSLPGDPSAQPIPLPYQGDNDDGQRSNKYLNVSMLSKILEYLTSAENIYSKLIPNMYSEPTPQKRSCEDGTIDKTEIATSTINERKRAIDILNTMIQDLKEAAERSKPKEVKEMEENIRKRKRSQH